MNEKNLKLAQQDIDEVLKTVEELEVQIDDLSKDDLKQKFVTLTEKVRKLEDLLTKVLYKRKLSLEISKLSFF